MTTDEQQESSKTREPRDEQFKNSIFTVPNVICMGRFGGSFVLFAVALMGWPYWFVGLFMVLFFSDWIDGKLARWLHQRSDLGAQLDSAADSILYAALIGGALILSWDLLQSELVWLAVGIGSYAVNTVIGLRKYGRVPSYHTRAGKLTMWLTMIAGISLILGWSVWPLRIAVVGAVITNLEATAITIVLKEWRADVLTLFHVWPADKQNNASTADEV